MTRVLDRLSRDSRVALVAPSYVTGALLPVDGGRLTT